jgi:hypothetical protein
MQSACAVLYGHLWPLQLYYIFPHYLINGTIFGGGGKLSNMKRVFWFSLQLLSEIFLLRRIRLGTIINVRRSSRKVPVIRVGFWRTVNYLGRFSRNTQIPNFMKIRPLGADLLHADGQTDMTKLTDPHDLTISACVKFYSRHFLLHRNGWPTLPRP